MMGWFKLLDSQSARSRSKETTTEGTKTTQKERNNIMGMTPSSSATITFESPPHLPTRKGNAIIALSCSPIQALPTPDPMPKDTPAPPEPELEPEQLPPEQQTLPSYATSAASKAIQRQLKQIVKLQTSTTAGEQRYWTLDLSRLDNLYHWYFTLHTFDPDIPLSKDMRKFGIEAIHLEVIFGPQHPSTPPFIRIVKPRFMQWMGGSICIPMLSMKGWKKDITVDHILMVVHSALSDLDPVPARLIGTHEYSVQEAVSAYIRVANTHGWRIPQNWKTLFTKN